MLASLSAEPECRAKPKHFRYAVLLGLQKNHAGVLASCFTEEKNADFFKKVNRMRRYIKVNFDLFLKNLEC